MEDTFSNLATYGYIGLFLYSLGGGFVALVGAGVLSYMGKMDIGTAIAVAFVANDASGTWALVLNSSITSVLLDSADKRRVDLVEEVNLSIDEYIEVVTQNNSSTSNITIDENCFGYSGHCSTGGCCRYIPIKKIKPAS